MFVFDIVEKTTTYNKYDFFSNHLARSVYYYDRTMCVCDI